MTTDPIAVALETIKTALRAVPDDAERARAAGVALERIPGLQAAIAEIRRDAVAAMYGPEGAPHMTYQQIAEQLGIHFTGVRRILLGDSSNAARRKRRASTD